MALLWIEGFEGFGTTVGGAPTPSGVFARKYTVQSENGFRLQAGRWGGYSLQFVIDNCYLQPPDLTTNNTLVVGLAYRTLNGTSHELLTFYNGANRNINLRWVNGGNLAIYKGDVQLAVTAGLGLVTNRWYYFEMKVLAAAAGSVSVRVDETPVLSYSGDTRQGATSYHTTFRIQDVWGETPSVAALYCLDGAAGANDFLGVKQVVTIFPNGAGATTQWTPNGAAANYDCVDEAAADDASTYVATAGAGNLDLYAYGDISASDMDGEIVGVQINTEARRTQSTDYNLYQPCSLSGTQSDGAARTIASDTFVTATRVMAADPSGAGWTIDNVNLAQFGVLLG